MIRVIKFILLHRDSGEKIILDSWRDTICFAWVASMLVTVSRIKETNRLDKPKGFP